MICSPFSDRNEELFGTWERGRDHVLTAPSLWAREENSGMDVVSSTEPLAQLPPCLCPSENRRSCFAWMFHVPACFLSLLVLPVSCTSNYIPTLKTLPASGTPPSIMLCLVSATKWSSSCWSTAPCPSQPSRTSLPSKSKLCTKATRSGKLSETARTSSWSMSSCGKMLLPSKSQLLAMGDGFSQLRSGLEGRRGSRGESLK